MEQLCDAVLLLSLLLLLLPLLPSLAGEVYRKMKRCRLLKTVLVVAVLSLLGFWRVSPVFSNPSSILINEFVPNPMGLDSAPKPEGEWVELYNPTGEDLDVGGWVLTDSYDLTSDHPHILKISPDNTNTSGVIVESKSYLVVYRDGDSDFSLNQSDDQVRLFDDSDNLTDSVSYSGSIEEGKSWSLRATEWVKGTDPTPGAGNSFLSSGGEEEQVRPKMTFSSPSSVEVAREFSVTVKFSDFGPGTYALKVLVGKGNKFIYGNTKGSNGWLSQNGPWKDMPQVKVGSSGSVSKTVQAKTDDDTPPGSYEITVSVAEKDGSDYKTLWSIKELETKALKVVGVSKTTASSTRRSVDVSGSEEDTLTDITSDPEGFESVNQGEVLGEEVPQEKPFKLNFYIVLGIFGVLVGMGGVILAVRYDPAP